MSRASDTSSSRSALLVGDVVHVRTGEHRRRFRYRHCSWLLDLDELDELERTLAPVFGVDRRRPLALKTATHLPLETGEHLRDRIASCLTRMGRPAPDGRILLVSNVAAFGYVFDPVSWICCHDEHDQLHTIIAEVHNTFGESHTYAMPVDATSGWVGTETPKALHVSPFLPNDLYYELAALPPTNAPSAQALGEPVAFRVSVRDEHGRTRFVGIQRGARRALTRAAVARELLRSPVQPQLVTARIHAQALRLWARGAPLHRKPPFTPHVGSHHRSAA